jgi:F-type H+-transporting ATPase subunit delta
MPGPRSTARRYAEAAFQIAERDDAIDRWLEDLHDAVAALDDESIARVLQNPAVPLDARQRLLDAALADRPAPVRNLVALLLRRGRIELLPDVVREYQRLRDRRAGIVTAAVTSASALDEHELRALTQRLEQMTGGQVRLETDVDPGILGGVVVRLGDRLIDGSVRGRLERLRTRLASGVL